MKMAKPSERDIEEAGKAMALLNTIDGGYYPSKPDDENAPLFFDEDDPDHLRLFYDEMKATIETGWPGRVIGGMCFAIMNPENKILDPDDDCLSLHPRIEAALKAFEKWSIDMRATSWVIHRNDKSIEHTTDAKTADEAHKLGFVVENQFINPVSHAKIEEAISYKAEQRSMIIGQAVCHSDGKWPKELGGGTMFFNGERITFEQFIERAKLAYPELYNTGPR